MTPSPHTKVTIRDLRAEDYDELARLWDAAELPFHPEGRDSRENVERELGSGQADFFVMEVGGKMVGAALCTNDGRKGWINRLAVDPKHRRTGIASMLVKEAERRFDARGLGISACLVHNDNPSSIALFEDLGYTLDSRVLYYSKRKSDRI